MWFKDCTGAAKAFSYVKGSKSSWKSFALSSAKTCEKLYPKASLVFYKKILDMKINLAEKYKIEKKIFEINGYKIQNYSKALLALEEMLKLNLNSKQIFETRFAQAQMFLRQKRYKQSLIITEDLLKNTKDKNQRADLLVLKSSLLFLMKDYVKARKFYKEQVEKISSRNKASIFLEYIVLSLEEEGKLSEALMYLKKMKPSSFVDSKQRELLSRLKSLPRGLRKR